MTTSNTVTKTDLQNIINAIFPATTEDMTQAQIDAFVASLNCVGINAVDYVVEQGVSSDTTYRKWNSGVAECWIYTTQNVAINSTYGSLYQGTWQWQFPFEFTSAPIAVCSYFKWGTGASWGTVSVTNKGSATLRGIDTTSRASGSTVIQAYAKGYWK